MKVNIRVDTSKDDKDEIIRLINYLYADVKDDSVSQMKLGDNNSKESISKDRKYFCNNPDCKKEITKTVVAFCLHPDNKDRFGGKVFCRVCQEGK